MKYNKKFIKPAKLTGGVLVPYEEKYSITGLYDAFKNKAKFWHLDWDDKGALINNKEINQLIKDKGFTLVTINDFIERYSKVTFFTNMKSLKSAYSKSSGVSYSGDL